MPDSDPLNVERSALNVERSGSAGPANASSAIDADNPWPGLSTFTEDQRAFFHGRDEEILDLTQLAERRPLVVLFGQSGLGKSSILQAGVFPRMRADGFCPVYVRLDHGEGAPSPTEQIKTLVRTETAKSGTWTKPGAAKPGETLWEFFHHRDDRLVDRDGLGVVPVLVFDQFEELFTLGAAKGERRDRAVSFMRELAELVENRPSKTLVARLDQSSAEMEAFDFGRTDYRVIISLREDFLPDLETLKTIMPALMQKRMRLARMTGQQALEAVLKPGAKLVEEPVARAIVEFVAGARGGSAERLAELDVEPALLSVVCRELNERRRAKGQEKITLEQVSGDRREILNDFYERSVGDLPEAVRRFVEDRLLTKSGFRDNFALETALEEPGVTRELIDTLVARRLLRIEDRLGVQRVELTHDVLAEVIRGSRDARQQRLAVRQALRHTRRLRFAVAGLVLMVIGLGIGAVFGIRAQRRAAEQAGRADLQIGSRLLDDGRVGDGLAHLVSAARKAPRNSLIATRLVTALAYRNFHFPVGQPLDLPSPAQMGGFSRDGRLLGALLEDGSLAFIDLKRWEMGRRLTFDQKVRRGGVRISEDASLLAVVLEDGRLLVCDLETGKPKFPALKPGEGIPGNWPRFDLSLDGRWVAASSSTEVHVWDAATGAPRITLPNSSTYRIFAFSPDGQRIVTTEGRETRIWSVVDGTPVGEPINNAANFILPTFSRDGKRLAVWNMAGVLVCDPATGQPVAPFIPFPGNPVNEILLSNDGSKLLTIATDGLARVIDVASGRPVYAPLQHRASVTFMQLSADGRTLFTNSLDGYFRLWDFETGKLRAESTLRQPRLTPAGMSDDGQTVALFPASGKVYRFRPGQGAAEPLHLPRDPDTTRMVNWAVSPEPHLVWLGPAEATLIDVTTGQQVPGGWKYPTAITGISRSQYGGTMGPGEYIVVAVSGGSYEAWTVGEKGISHHPPLDGLRNASQFKVDPISKLAATSGTPTQRVRTLDVYDATTGRKIVTLNAEVNFRLAYFGHFSPDGKRGAFQTTDEVFRFYDLSSGKQLFAIQPADKATIIGSRFTPDGKEFLTGDSWGTIQVWDATNGQLLRSNQAHRGNVTRFEFSPNGQQYASLSVDGSVQVWATKGHTPIGNLLEQAGPPGRADFSADGRRLVLPSSSGTTRFWDVETSLPLTDVLPAGGEPTNVIAFSRDGRFVESHGGLSGIRVWPSPPDGNGATTPGWLLRLATICAGVQLNEQGKFQSAMDELPQFAALQAEIAAAPASDPYAAWGKWIISDAADRPIAPGFKITRAAAAEVVQRMRSKPHETLEALQARLTLLLQEGRLAEVEALQRQILALVRERAGAETTQSSDYLMSLVLTLVRAKRFEAADLLSQESVTVREKFYPPESSQVSNSRALRGQVLVGLQRYAEAEPLLLQGYENWRRQSAQGPGPLRAREIAAALAELYIAQGNAEKAAEWRAKATVQATRAATPAAPPAENATPAPASRPAANP